ncbi:MAG TPA: transcriptional regulator [Prevotella sp.]|nr:transcriptional regulator [Prevotella sp.]
MKIGDKVLVSPDLTHKSVWENGEVIKVEDNSFVGKVVSAKTDDGDIFFGYQDMFKPANNTAVCMP